MAAPLHETPAPEHMPVLHDISFPPELGLAPLYQGKVRDIFSATEDQLLLVTTDRVSAFDVVLGTVPGKGQILNELSAWWFSQMGDIVPHHMIALPDPNVMIAKKLTPVPIEVIVRGVITGVTDTSLWVNYEKTIPDADGFREVYGIRFPPGLNKNDILPEPVITPTTKAEAGLHDEKITEREIIERGIVGEKTWTAVRNAAVAMFRRAQEIARERGFLLVDTKMEFGTDQEGKIYIMDELFTPDSSRYWLAATLEARLAAGQEPDNFDKEFLRIAYKAAGYSAEERPDQVPLAIQEGLLKRYVALYEGLTGKKFVVPNGDIVMRIRANVAQHLLVDVLTSREKEKLTPQVVIIMGSGSDRAHAESIQKTLTGFGIPSVLRVASAHKNPADVLRMVNEYDAMERRQNVYIAVAGRSNALGGMIAGATTRPVINCPPKGEMVDIFSSLRMPSGIAASFIIEPESAAVHAAEIFALTRPELRGKLEAYQEQMREKIRQADMSLTEEI